MSQTDYIQSNNGVANELKPDAPTSTIDILVLGRLDKFLHPIWRQKVHENSNELKGINVIGLFDLEKLVKPNFWKLREQLSILPTDTFEYLKYQRRRIQKKLKRKVRDYKKVNLVNIEKSNIRRLQLIKEKYLEERRELLEDILFYKQETEHSYATIQYPHYHTQYPQYQYNQQCYNGYNTQQVQYPFNYQDYQAAGSY